ncbi:MAG: hypothetical protein ACR2HM_02370 [Acidimicrobiales bacterium]
MNEATPEDRSGSPSLSGQPGEAERSEALEDQLKQLTARLARWVESQLARAVDDRRGELGVLRTELLEAFDSRLADRTAGPGPAGDEVAARVDAFERRVKVAMGRLTDSVEARLADTLAAREAELEALRSSFGDRLDRLEQGDNSAGESVAALRLSTRAAAERIEALEQQAKAAVARLEQSVEARLEALAAQVRVASDGVAAAQAEAGAGPARSELLEQRVRSAMGRLAESVEARLSEAVEGRQAELATLRSEVDDAMARHVREARAEIGSTVADAHRRFVVSVDALNERMAAVTRESASAKATLARIETLPEAVASDGRRIESIEAHTRRTDARLEALVDTKLAELAARGQAEVAGARDELAASVDTRLADIWAEVALALGDGRAEVAAGAGRIDAALAAVDRSRRDAEERLAHAMQVRLDELDKAAAEVVAGRAEVAAAVAALDRRTDEAIDKAAAEVAAGRADVAAAVVALDRRTDEAEDRVRRQVEDLAVQVAGLVRTATAEGGVLAPVRSDIRLLQDRVAELVETVAELRPRRKADAPASKPKARKAAPAKKAPAKRSAARRQDQ